MGIQIPVDLIPMSYPNETYNYTGTDWQKKMLLLPPIGNKLSSFIQS